MEKKSDVLYGLSKKEGSKTHLYLLPGQYLEDGTATVSKLRVQCMSAERDSHPALTIFALEKSKVFLASAGTYYCASKSPLTPVGSIPSTIDAQGKIFWFIPISNTPEAIEAFNPALVSNRFWQVTVEDVLEFGKKTPDNTSVRFRIQETHEGPLVKIYSSPLQSHRPEIVRSREAVVPFVKDTLFKNNIFKADPTIFTTPSPSSAPEEEKMDTPKPYIGELFEGKPELKCPNSDLDGFFMKDRDWKLLIRNIKRHVNTLITGPAGTGKTSCVKLAADRLGLPLYTFDMGAMVDPISSLLGVHRLQDGRSVFDYAQFTECIQKPCIILLDELSRAPIGVGNVLFPCLDDRRILPIEIAGGSDKRSISIHPEVTFIATANVGAEYTGTTVLDKALVNRFFPLELGYLPEKEESKVLIKRTGIKDKESSLIVQVANTLRTMNKKMEISTSVSVRETLMISQLVSDGWKIGEAMKAVYIPMFPVEDGDGGEREKIFKVLASY